MFAGGVEQLAGRERHGRGVEEAASRVDEWDDEDELERIDDVVANLRGGYVEAEEEGESEAENGGAANDGVDADEESGGDAPGKLLRRSSHAEEREDGKGEATIDPVMVDWSTVWKRGALIWLVWLHFLQDKLRLGRLCQC